MSESIRIRLLNGALSGREIVLPNGELSVGGAEADLAIVLDQGVQTKIVADATGVRLDPPVPCWIDGKLVTPEQRLPLGVALDIAGCGIALGTPSMSLERLQMMPRVIVRGAPFWIWPTFSSVVLVILTFAGLLSWQAYYRAQEQVRRDHQRGTTQLLADFKSMGIMVQRDSNRIYQLSGSCASSAVVEPLRRQMRRLGYVFQDQLICDDELLTTVRNTLALNGYLNIEVKLGKASRTVDIYGAISGDARWQKTATMLASLPGLAGWSVSDGGGQLARDLIERLRDAGLLGRLSVVRSNNVLLVTGHLDQEQLAALARVSAAFVAASPGATRLIHQNIAPNAAQAGVLPAPMVSFGTYERSAYVDLSNGVRLRTGSRLPNGYEVVSLDANGIDLLKKDELVHLPLPL